MREERFLRTAFCPFFLVVYCQRQEVNVAMLSCVMTHENDRAFAAQACDACMSESSYVWDDACFEHLPTDSQAS